MSAIAPNTSITPETSNSLFKTKIKLKRPSNEKLFEYGVILSKLSAIGTLFYFSYKHAYSDFIAKNPQRFLSECLLVGGSAIVSSLVLVLTRIGFNKINAKILNGFLTVFMIFFIFHMLMEMSEFNNSEYFSQFMTDNKVFVGIIGSCGILMTLLAIKIWDFNIAKNNNCEYTSYGWFKFLSEAFAFGAINAVPTVLISKDRNEGKVNIEECGYAFALYSIGYVLLEAGGFFKHTIGTKNQCPKLDLKI